MAGEVNGVGVNPTAAYLGQLKQQQATTKPQTPAPGTLPSGVGYNPNESVSKSSSYVSKDPMDTPSRFAKMQLGEHADLNAKQLENKIDNAFASGQSIQVENTGKGKLRELTLTAPDGEKKTFIAKKDEAGGNVSHEIHNWLDTKGVPVSDRNFQVGTLKADELRPTIDALGAANHINVKSLENNTGTVDIDQARFAHIDENGKAVFERHKAKVKVGDLGQKQKELKLSGTDASDTLYTRWSGAPTSIDGKAGNDALAAVGNGKSTYTIHDDAGKNYIALINGGSNSKITTGQKKSQSISVNDIQVQSDASTKIESYGAKDFITLGGKAKHEVAVYGPNASIVQDSTSGHDYKGEDIKIKNGGHFDLSKEREVYDDTIKQNVIEPQAKYYRSAPGFFGTNTVEMSSAETQYAKNGTLPHYSQPPPQPLSPAAQLGISLGLSLTTAYLANPCTWSGSNNYASHHNDYYGSRSRGSYGNFGFNYSGRS